MMFLQADIERPSLEESGARVCSKTWVGRGSDGAHRKLARVKI